MDRVVQFPSLIGQLVQDLFVPVSGPLLQYQEDQHHQGDQAEGG